MVNELVKCEDSNGKESVNLRDLLSNARIPKAFIGMKLTDFCSGDVIRNDIKTGAFLQMFAKEFVSVLCRSLNNKVDPVTVFEVLCKELVLSGLPIYRLPIHDLVALLRAGNEQDLKFIRSVPILAIPNFAGKAGTFPYSLEDRSVLESFLSDRILNKKPILMCSLVSMNLLDGWWSSFFVSYVRNFSKEYHLD